MFSRRSHLWMALLLVISTGCQTIPLFSGMNFPKADARHPVVEILCVWEPAEGRGLDNLPCRGFGGQVLFFSNGRKEPVKVEGDVRVYVFDELGVDGDSSKPLHQFDFPAAAWNAFLKPSNLGASYQIFVPYTRKGLHPASCTLRVRFTPEGGLPVYSRLATVILAGHDSAVRQRAKAKADQVVTVSHEDPEPSGQQIVTADWSQIATDSSSGAAAATESRVPSISLGGGTNAVRQARMLEQLRQAAHAAAQSPSVDPPRPLPNIPESSSVRPLSTLQMAHHSDEFDGQPSPAPTDSGLSRSSGSEGRSPPRRLHPLADSESN